MTKKKVAPPAGVKKVSKIGSGLNKSNVKMGTARKKVTGSKPATRTASHESSKRPKQQVASKTTNQFPVKTTAATSTKKKLTVGKTNI